MVNIKDSDAYAISVIKLTGMVVDKHIQNISFKDKIFNEVELLDGLIANRKKFNKSIYKMALQKKAEQLNSKRELLIKVKDMLKKQGINEPDKILTNSQLLKEKQTSMKKWTGFKEWQ